MGIRNNIEALLDAFNVTQEAFARSIGKTQGAVSQWLSGRNEPSSRTVERICEVYNLDKDDIMSDRHGLYAKLHGLEAAPAGAVAPAPSAVATLPLLGRIHAGEPTDPEEAEGVVELPASVAANHPHAYFVEVEGDCMDKVYPEGCYVLVDPDREPQDGSVAAVSIDGADYVMRRLKKGAGSLMLVPESGNPAHRDILVTEGDGKVVSLVGTVVWFQAKKEMG